MAVNRSAAFQLYPAKALAGTDHLSPEAFKAYWKVLWWMWLNSPNHYTMADTDKAWEMATGITAPKLLKKVRQEIMSPDWKLLSKRRSKLTSNGLRKEAEKQRIWREKSSAGGKKSARVRKQRKLGLDAEVKGGSKGGCEMVEEKSNTKVLSLKPSVIPPTPQKSGDKSEASGKTEVSDETSPSAKRGRPRESRDQRKKRKRESQEQRRQRMIEELHESEKQKHRGGALESIGSVLSRDKSAVPPEETEKETAPEIDVTPEADALGGGLV